MQPPLTARVGITLTALIFAKRSAAMGAGKPRVTKKQGFLARFAYQTSWLIAYGTARWPRKFQRCLFKVLKGKRKQRRLMRKLLLQHLIFNFVLFHGVILGTKVFKKLSKQGVLVGKKSSKCAFTCTKSSQKVLKSAVRSYKNPAVTFEQPFFRPVRQQLPLHFDFLLLCYRLQK